MPSPSLLKSFTLSRVQGVGDRGSVGHRPLDDLAYSAARLILRERAAALGHEGVGVEHTMIVAP